MSQLARLSIGAKLLLAQAGLAIALLLLLAGVAYRGVQQQQAELTGIYQVRLAHLRAAGEAAEAVSRAHAGVFQSLAQVSAGFPAAQIAAQARRLSGKLEQVGKQLERMAKEGATGNDELAVIEAALITWASTARAWRTWTWRAWTSRWPPRSCPRRARGSAI